MKYAGFWLRFGAHLIDFVITNAVELCIEYGIVAIVFLVRRFILGHTVDFDHAVESIVQQGIGIALGLYIVYFYYVRMQIKTGNTIGKRLMKIEVLDMATLLPMQPKQAWIRMFAYLPSYLLIGCGFLMAAFNSKKRALHDSIAGTIVVVKQT
jgi:uncharacterized RDD family membrane protein YckC